MSDYQYLSPLPSVTASGRPLAFGDEVELTSEELESNAQLLDSGSLLEKPAPQPQASAKAPSKTKESK